MKSSYPLTLAAAKKHEGCHWELGDALVKECPPDSSDGKLAEACAYLRANGCDYTEQWLAQLRMVAFAFPPKERRLSLSFEVHREAGSPKMLKAITSGAPKGTEVSSRYARKVVGQIWAHEEQALREAQEQAQAKRQAAKAEEKEILAKKQAAKSEPERKRLTVEHQQAVRRREQAQEAEQAIKIPPKKSLTPPTKEEVPVLLAEARFLANGERSIALAKEAAKVIEEVIEELTAKGVAGLTEVALEAANAWTEAAQIVRKEVIDQRGHLSVLEK